MSIPAFVAALAALATTASAALLPRNVPAGLQTPLPPSSDPFYTAPKGYEAAAPGTILRVRSAPGNLTAVVKNCSEAYNILYATTDSRYNASWAVTTLFTPLTSSDKRGGDKLLSYQIPYDSASVDASPSYALYASPPGDIATALGRGWYVNVPDYEGPLASFTAGVQSGHATLDSVRAALSTGSGLGLSDDARYAMWGYSGGALASEWGAELQEQYAPELDFVGAALGGLTPNVTSVLLAVQGSVEVGLVPAGMLGLASQWPEANQVIESRLKTSGPYNATGFNAARNYTLTQALGAYAGQHIADYFTDGLGILDEPMVKEITRRDGLMGGHGVPRMPIYAYKAIKDEVSPINDTDKLINYLCDYTTSSIHYTRNNIGGHSAESTNGAPAALAFLDSVLNAQYNSTVGCKIENVSVNITDIPFRR